MDMPRYEVVVYDQRSAELELKSMLCSDIIASSQKALW